MSAVSVCSADMTTIRPSSVSQLEEFGHGDGRGSTFRPSNDHGCCLTIELSAFATQLRLLTNHEIFMPALSHREAGPLRHRGTPSEADLHLDRAFA